MTAPTIPIQGQTPTDDFIDPAEQALGSQPRMRSLGEGRLCAFVPLRLLTNKVSKYKPEPHDVLVADIIVCDGTVVMYGGNPTDGTPDTTPWPVPSVIRNSWIDQVGLIDRLRDGIGRGVILARLDKVLTASGRKVWTLTKASDADKALAGPLLAKYRAGQFEDPTPPTPPPSPAIQPTPATPTLMPPTLTLPGLPTADWTLPYAAQFGIDPNQWAAYTVEQRVAALAQVGIKSPALTPGI